uniref:Uncharacterized protein n=1 Tax=Glossina brevipalpis TaxID=37001 RepID=A0A1A9X129_9MUSC
MKIKTKQTGTKPYRYSKPTAIKTTSLKLQQCRHNMNAELQANRYIMNTFLYKSTNINGDNFGSFINTANLSRCLTIYLFIDVVAQHMRVDGLEKTNQVDWLTIKSDYDSNIYIIASGECTEDIGNYKDTYLSRRWLAIIFNSVFAPNFIAIFTIIAEFLIEHARSLTVLCDIFRTVLLHN